MSNSPLRSASILPEADVHPGLAFRYCPLTPEDRETLARLMASDDEDHVKEQALAVLASRLVAWNRCTPQGEPEPLSVETLGRLPAALLVEVWRTVLVREPPKASVTSADTLPDDDRELAWAVRLILNEPAILGRTCAECRRWVFDERHRHVKHRGALLARAPGVPTPCHSCPKHDAEQGERFDRQATAVMGLIARSREVAATCGACLFAAERVDNRLHRRLAVVQAVQRSIELQDTARLVVEQIRAQYRR